MRAESSDENSILREDFWVFRFLSKFLKIPGSSPLPSRQRDALMTQQKVDVYHLLYRFSDFSSLYVPLEDFLGWYRHIYLGILREDLATFEGSDKFNEVMIKMHVTEAQLMHSRGLRDEALISLKEAAALLQAWANPNSAGVAYHHCVLAVMYQVLQGSDARTVYMEEAFRSCPRLLN